MNRRLIALILAAAMLLALSACGKNGGNDETELYTEEVLTDAQGVPLPPNPVDFDYWQGMNDEIYAYITVPGTNVDYPIVQSKSNDNFYLTHDYTGKYSYKGAVFTQSHNNFEFTDPVSVVYGHNTDKNDLFSQLLYFQDADFFASHDTFTICIPGHVITYKIISAHTYDNRHILNSFNFRDPAVLKDFQNSLLNPTALVRNVREGITLGPQDRVVILSTCSEHHSGGTVRFIVNGLEINDEETR